MILWSGNLYNVTPYTKFYWKIYIYANSLYHSSCLWHLALCLFNYTSHAESPWPLITGERYQNDRILSLMASYWTATLVDWNSCTSTVPKTFASNPHPTPNNVSFIDQAKVKLCQGNKLITMKFCNIIFGTVSCVFTFLVVWLWSYKYFDITVEFSIQLNC